MPDKRQQADCLYAAGRPTVDELLTNSKEFNRVSADFLKVDLQTALTLTGVALQTHDSIQKRRNRRSARKAYDIILKLVDRVDLTDDDAQTLSRNLDRLKSELQTLGEVF